MKRFYWTHPDVLETEVEVKAVADCNVTITPTLFHPDEGGQPADKGTIGEATVWNVEVVDGRIVHMLDRPLADGKYPARLDKQHRLYAAGQHTAQHILSGIAQKQFDLRTAGVHIGLEKCTVDFDKRIDWDTAAELERQSMEVVTLDIPVETVFDDTNVRMRNDADPIEADIIRVVKIGGYDKSACCGAHLGATAQVGVIRILGIENKKKGTRVTFLAGTRALAYSQLETSVLRELRKAAGCSTSELPMLLRKALDRTNELSKEIERLWSLLLPGLAESAQIVEIESTKIGIHVAEIPNPLLTKLAAMIAETVGGAGIAVSDLNVAIRSGGGSAKDILARIQNV
ncbi:MAG: alanyl-tRNA editing protein, partial [Planctomycetota bacterium]